MRKLLPENRQSLTRRPKTGCALWQSCASAARLTSEAIEVTGRMYAENPNDILWLDEHAAALALGRKLREAAELLEKRRGLASRKFEDSPQAARHLQGA